MSGRTMQPLHTICTDICKVPLTATVNCREICRLKVSWKRGRTNQDILWWLSPEITIRERSPCRRNGFVGTKLAISRRRNWNGGYHWPTLLKQPGISPPSNRDTGWSESVKISHRHSIFRRADGWFLTSSKLDIIEWITTTTIGRWSRVTWDRRIFWRYTERTELLS